MKQKEAIWAIIGALILSECILGVAVQGEHNDLAIAQKPILIWEFAPYCENGLEYIVLKNTGAAISLNGFVLSDGEGKITFGDFEFPAYSTYTFANNATAYYQYFEKMPDFEIRSGKDLTVKGLFKLANSNEELFLYSPDGTLVDSVGYGKERVLMGWNGSLLKNPSSGTVYRRFTVTDTDTANDWTITKIGRTAFSPVRFPSVSVTAFVTPDSGLNVVLQNIERARREILVCTYTIDSPEIICALENASKRNVSVNVFVESAPVGGQSVAESAMLSKLSRFANISFYGTPKHIRYDYLHAKYIVIDENWVLVSTENWKRTSYVEHGLCGNRGWGVVVESPELAQKLATLFREDVKTAFGDVGRLQTLASNWEPERNLNRTLSNFTAKTSIANVTLLAAPDNTLAYLLRCLTYAKESVILEAMDLPLYWGKNINPFIEKLVDLGRNGIEVKVLLDGGMSNGKSNRETTDYLNSLNANISARIIDNKGHGYRVLHTKGFVIDNAYVYLGSTNFCENSFSANREVGVFIESREIATYFASVFEFDWKEDVKKPSVYIGIPSKILVGKSVRFDGSGSADNGRIVSYLWDFNSDGIFDVSGAVVNYTFSKPGKYMITLKVVDACENENSTTREVTVGEVEEEPSAENQNWIYIVMPVMFVIIAGWTLKRMEKSIQKFVSRLRCKI